MTRLLNGIVAFGSTLLLAVTLIGAGFAAVAHPRCGHRNAVAGVFRLRPAEHPVHRRRTRLHGHSRQALHLRRQRPRKAWRRHRRGQRRRRGRRARHRVSQGKRRTQLTADAISHLDDVYRVACVAKPALVIVAMLCIAGLAHVAVRIGRRALGRTLIAGGGLVLAAFCALGAWAAIDFDGLFAAFHSLFFQAGTWTFPYDSLLITLYPTAFWMGMGGIWHCSYLRPVYTCCTYWFYVRTQAT